VLQDDHAYSVNARRRLTAQLAGAMRWGSKLSLLFVFVSASTKLLDQWQMASCTAKETSDCGTSYAALQCMMGQKRVQMNHDILDQIKCSLDGAPLGPQLREQDTSEQNGSAGDTAALLRIVGRVDR
jgi:hypothetical protein